MKISQLLKTKDLPFSTTPRLDLELLLEKASGKVREFFYTNPNYQLTKEQTGSFESLYQRRKRGEPIAHILGKKEFWSYEFVVNNKVLIPRPETELLIEIVLERLKKEKADVADLGTGSGAIALTLAKERPDWNVIATDISTDALQVASHNAMNLEVQNIEFYCGNWCEALPDRKFDLIVSNPPYINKDDPHLEKKDVSFEPKIALESGDGLDALKIIISSVKNKLKPGGFLLLEHGHDQRKRAVDLLRELGYKNINVYKDLAGIDRAVAGELNKTEQVEEKAREH